MGSWRQCTRTGSDRGSETSMPHITPRLDSGRATPRGWFTLWDAITSVTFPFNWVTNDSFLRQRSFSVTAFSPLYFNGGLMKDGFSDRQNHTGAASDIYISFTSSLVRGKKKTMIYIIYQSPWKQLTVMCTCWGKQRMNLTDWMC